MIFTFPAVSPNQTRWPPFPPCIVFFSLAPSFALLSLPPLC